MIGADDQQQQQLEDEKFVISFVICYILLYICYVGTSVI
jgi:hypothetical protein